MDGGSAEMLTNLRIANLGVITEATLEPATGMTAVTGETGAGKTMIVTGLGFLLGARADTGLVRVGSHRMVVEGRFTGLDAVRERLDDLGAELDDEADEAELLVSRQVQETGRSRALLGGVQVPAGTLVDVVGELATIHGQSDQIRLGSPERQREVLDRAGGPAAFDVLQRYRVAYQKRRQVEAELDALVTNAQERSREQGMLIFGMDEIAAVDPQPGEDEKLAAQAHRLQAVDDLRLAAEQASHALSGSAEGDWDDPGALGLLGQTRKALDQVSSHDPTAAEMAQQAAEVLEQVGDLSVEVASYLAGLEADPRRLEAIASRRAQIQELTRKYGKTADEVIAWAENARQRLTQLQGGDERIVELVGQREQLTSELMGLAAQLSAQRRTTATRLADAVRGELAALAMPAATLRFQLTPLNELGPGGAESVQILFSANPGSELAPLAKAASGGELSRVRLALEVVLAGADRGHTFVFDEVDAGVGGAVGLEIGRRLARLAQTSQVIVVTHLAQVAVFADRQFVVSKSNDGQVTTADVSEVTGDARVAEVARMMGGLAESDAGLRHARDLLAEARR